MFKLVYKTPKNMANLLYYSFSFSRNFEHEGDEESLELEGDIDGGLVLRRKIYIPKEDTKILKINSNIVAVKVGAGSGGFSRFAPNIPICHYFILRDCHSSLETWMFGGVQV